MTRAATWGSSAEAAASRARADAFETFDRVFDGAEQCAHCGTALAA